MAHQQDSLDFGNESTARNTSHDVGFIKYINDEVFTYIFISITTVITGLVSIGGVVTNLINIIVFIRQGVFSDSSTVSLLSLAVGDFFSAASMLWIGIFICLARFEPPGLNWKPSDIMYMAGAWPHVVAGLITRMITAFIAFERCFCVVFPFKVKTVFSSKCSFASMVSIFSYYILTYSPVYFLNTFHYIDDPITNRTLFVLLSHPNWQIVQTIISYTNHSALSITSVTIVLICTTITASRVKLSSAWRNTMTTDNTKSKSESNSDQRSKDKEEKSQKLSSSKMQKEKKMIRMITLISTLFLISYVPNIPFMITYSINRQVRTDGKYSNLAWTMFSISWLSETINSSINIFIYNSMSTKYRKEFDKLMGIKEK